MLVLGFILVFVDRVLGFSYRQRYTWLKLVWFANSVWPTDLLTIYKLREDEQNRKKNRKTKGMYTDTEFWHCQYL